MLSSSIRTKIYRTISLNIVLYGLSYQDAQLLKLQNYIAPTQQVTFCYVRNINSFTIDEFQSKLNTESWEDIFEGFDTNVTFSNFLNIHLKIVYPCFTKTRLNSMHRYNLWITGGIKLSCHNKRLLYMCCRGNNVTNHLKL